MSMFKPANKKQSKLRLAISGVSGSGKTYTSLLLAQELAGGKRFAVIDTENGSASLYSDKFKFDVLELSSFSPETYTAAIVAAHKEGYTVLVIDSLTHAWAGTDGALEQVDRAAAASKSNNTYFAWRGVTPKHQGMVNAIVQSPMHIIATMREKADYVINDTDKKKVPQKVGTQPIQREGLEYEFTVYGKMDLEHRLIIEKTRCSVLDGKHFTPPTADIAKTLLTWLNSGEPQNQEQGQNQGQGQAGKSEQPPPPSQPQNQATNQPAAAVSIDDLKGEYSALANKIKVEIEGEPLLDIMSALKLKKDSGAADFEKAIKAMQGILKDEPDGEVELLAKLYPYTKEEISTAFGDTWTIKARMTPVNARHELYTIRHSSK